MPERFPKISVVTATYNQGPYIEACIQSVLGQGYPNLEYIVIDGGSTDNSIEIIKKYTSQLSYFISEKDNGLYDALNKGFLQSTGEIMGWINSDDLLHHLSLFTIAEIFNEYSQVKWVQGHPNVVDNSGRILYQREPRNGHFDFLLKKYHDGIFIQQESTYWRRELWNKAGSFISAKYKYAGDFELWMRYFQFSSLYTTSAFIGSFRLRGKGQLSSDNYEQYLKECDQITDESISQLSESHAIELRKMAREEKRRSFFLYRKLAKKKRTAAGNHIYYDFVNSKFIMNGQ